MASLKYYETERKMFGDDLRGIIFFEDLAREIRRACRHFRVPAIRYEFWRGRYSFYDRDDRFIRFAYHDSRGWGDNYIHVASFLHELAHYLDDCNRAREIEALPTNNIQAYVRQSIKIRNAKWHGPRHRAQMMVLVKWWLN